MKFSKVKHAQNYFKYIISKYNIIKLITIEDGENRNKKIKKELK